jgi:predicted TPR repeat methyltransferase
MSSHNFNEDYYENGVKNQLSGYENYRWMPTRSIPEAMSIIDNIEFDSCVDFGCAKGYLVHALNLLGKNAIGLDISQYAIANCHPAVKGKVFDARSATVKGVDLVIAKDVLEHITEQDIPATLAELRAMASQALFVIPLGENGLFRIREYEIDKTHVTRQDEEWWIGKMREAGFQLVRFSYEMGRVKENWSQYPFGNGFFHVK